MAAVSEVPQQTNWKNVNNWHWVSKNCTPWAGDYFRRELVDISAEDGAGSAKTTSVLNFSGDVELNQRKGKLITVFDLHITVNWEGKLADETAGTGRIKFPEFMNDQTAEDIEFDIAVEGDASEAGKRQLRDWVKKVLVPAVKAKMLAFPEALIAEQSRDILIPPEQMKGHPANRPYTPPAKTPSPAPPKPAATGPTTVQGTVVKLELDVEFQCTASDLYLTLLDRGRVSAWTRAPAEIQPQVGTLFRLFGDNVTGYVTELEPEKKIGMRWRLKEWPADHFSTVQISLNQESDCTKLHLVQDNVPIGQKDQVQANWTNFYFNPIKMTFGYGAILTG
ncbi:activator of Hsp90 ATPase [Hyaloraphidium curvatum]|nr:activator of Hsp90 ATPase [Hyaloraphidium curvatum]